MKYEVQTVADLNNTCGEAPTWDPANSRVIWTDNESDTVYQLPATGGEASALNRGLMVGGIALNRGGGLVFCGFGGLHVWHGQDDYRTVIAEYEGEALQFNDMIADPQGRIYAGTLYWGAEGMEKPGRLYLIDADGTTRVADEGIELSNGLGFSLDNRTIYFTDSAARRIYAYDIEPATGKLSNRRVFVQVSDNEGIPDGLTVDAEGFVWSAQWYGAQIVRYDPDGKVERRIAMPVKQVSSLTFGGKDLTDLYVTSAGASWPSRLMPPGYDPDAPDIGGALYRIRLDIQGRPEHQARF